MYASTHTFYDFVQTQTHEHSDEKRSCHRTHRPDAHTRTCGVPSHSSIKPASITRAPHVTPTRGARSTWHDKTRYDKTRLLRMWIPLGSSSGLRRSPSAAMPTQMVSTTGESGDARPDGGAKVPTIAEIRAVIPKSCFQHSLVRAFGLVIRDALVTMAFFCTALLLLRVPGDAQLSWLDVIGWAVYGFAQGRLCLPTAVCWSFNGWRSWCWPSEVPPTPACRSFSEVGKVTPPERVYAESCCRQRARLACQKRGHRSCEVFPSREHAQRTVEF